MEKKTLEYTSGVDLVNEFMRACKRIDPSLRSIRIITKGDLSSDIKAEWDVKKEAKRGKENRTVKPPSS